MTASAPTTRASRRSRDPPFPNSILDRKALERALDDANISVKKQHVDSFYQGLHRQHYPPLDEFVANYYMNERKQGLDEPVQPLKNKMTKKKNRNKMQLPKSLLQFLGDPNNGFVTITSRVHEAKTSKDGTTTKLAIELHDGHLIESVLMRYVTVGGSRASLCVSSQVGCAMGCTFCATGTMGIKGNLTTGEILEQIVHADYLLAKQAESAKENYGEEQAKNLDVVRNVVAMGMGEPLNNYDNVVEACRGLIDRKRWNLAHGRVTISTVGVTPRIHDLTRDLPQVCLALSLHAPNQEMRSAIVPAAKAYKIEGLIDALDKHMMGGAKRDYTREERIREMEGDTSSFECAHQLGKLCENRHLVVNLIPYNQTDVKDKLKCPSEAHMEEFRSIVASYGSFVTIRRTMGADIDSACGQLVKKTSKASENADIEDGPFHGLNGSGSKSMDRGTTGSFGGSPGGCPEEEELSHWIKPLIIATTIAASCFVASSVLFLSQKRKR